MAKVNCVNDGKPMINIAPGRLFCLSCGRTKSFPVDNHQRKKFGLPEKESGELFVDELDTTPANGGAGIHSTQTLTWPINYQVGTSESL